VLFLGKQVKVLPCVASTSRTVFKRSPFQNLVDQKVPVGVLDDLLKLFRRGGTLTSPNPLVNFGSQDPGFPHVQEAVVHFRIWV